MRRKYIAGERERKIIYSKTWVRSFVSNLFYSLYSRSGVCDCVCVRDTPDVSFFSLFICGFLFFCRLHDRKKNVSRYSQEADATSLT